MKTSYETRKSRKAGCDDGSSIYYVSGWVVLTVLVSTLIALAISQNEINYVGAAIGGACIGTISVWLLGVVVASITKTYWTYVNGYPFETGTTVYVKRGVQAGRVGRIVSADQGGFSFQVQFDDVAHKEWLPAKSLSTHFP